MTSTSQTVLDLSVIVPAYNEAEFIDNSIANINIALNKTGLQFELIIVDDGSQDKTRLIAKSLLDTYPNLRVIGYDVNQGKGFACREGFNHARGRNVVFLDGDLDVDVSQISDYVKKLGEGDLVIASKYHQCSKTDIPFIRIFLSYGFSILVNLVTGLRLRDTQTGLKAVRRGPLESVFKVLTINRFAFDVELLAVSKLHNLKIVELPVSIKLTNRLFSPIEVSKMFIDLFILSYRLHITKIYGAPPL